MGCRERTIKQLEAKAAVLERGRESAERRHRTDLACERKAAEAAKAEAAQLKVGALGLAVPVALLGTALHLHTAALSHVQQGAAERVK